MALLIQQRLNSRRIKNPMRADDIHNARVWNGRVLNWWESDWWESGSATRVTLTVSRTPLRRRQLLSGFFWGFPVTLTAAALPADGWFNSSETAAVSDCWNASKTHRWEVMVRYQCHDPHLHMNAVCRAKNKRPLDKLWLCQSRWDGMQIQECCVQISHPTNGAF